MKNQVRALFHPFQKSEHRFRSGPISNPVLTQQALSDRGGTLYVEGRDGGGAGRIRIDTTDRTGLNPAISPANTLVIGSFMTVFPPSVPRLDIVSAAGTAIAKGTSNPVSVVLPFNSPTTQNVTVEATNFTGTVPIRIVVTRETGGDPVNYDSTITVPANASTAQATVAVQIPVNVPVKINAWTR